MAATILVSVALSFLAGLVAHGLEKVFAYGRLPRRIVWLMGLFPSVTLTTFMLFQSGSMLQMDPTSDLVAWIRFAPGAALQPFVVRYIPPLGWPQIDRLSVEAWVVSCVIYVTYLLWQGLWEGARLRTESLGFPRHSSFG
jgi:hypothetical protein